VEFNREYQEELIGKAASQRFMEEVGYLLSPDMFEPDLGEVVDRVAKTWRKDKKALSTAQIQQACRRVGVKYKGAKSGSIRFDRDCVLEFARYMILRKAGTRFHAYHEDGKFDKAIQAIIEAKKTLPTLSNGQAPDILTTDLPFVRRKNVIPTGLEALDDALKGGAGGGNLAIVLAPTSGGKTSLLTWIGGTAALQGKKVYHVSLEVDAAEVSAKYRCRVMNREQPDKVNALKEFKKDWKKAQKRLARKGGSIRVRHYAPHEVSSTELDNELPDDVDILIVDYIDLLRPPSGSIGIMHEDLGTLSVDLRRIGDERGIPVWSASQVNRAAYDKKVAEVQDVEASLKKMQACTQAISINQMDNERKPHMDTGIARGTLYVAKNTFGRRFDEIALQIHWGRCWFKTGEVI